MPVRWFQTDGMSKNSYMDRSSAVLDPVSADVWAVHAGMSEECTPNSNCHEYQSYLMRLRQ